MRPPVQAKHGDRLFLLVLNDQSQGIGVRCSDFQGVLHRLLQCRQRVLLQQTQDADEFTGSVAVLFGLQASPENAEAHRQVPFLEGLCMVETAGLSLQQSEIMKRLVMELLFAPIAFVSGNEAVFKMIRTSSTVPTTVTDR